MAVSKVIHRWAYPVREALGLLSAEEKQWHFVKINTDSTLSLATSADEIAFVLEDTPRWDTTVGVGDAGTVALVGVPKVRTAEEIKAGQPVSCNAAGLAVVAASGQFIQGFAVHTAKSGTLCPILVSPLGAKQ